MLNTVIYDFSKMYPKTITTFNVGSKPKRLSIWLDIRVGFRRFVEKICWW